MATTPRRTPSGWPGIWVATFVIAGAAVASLLADLGLPLVTLGRTAAIAAAAGLALGLRVRVPGIMLLWAALGAGARCSVSASAESAALEVGLPKEGWYALVTPRDASAGAFDPALAHCVAFVGPYGWQRIDPWIPVRTDPLGAGERLIASGRWRSPARPGADHWLQPDAFFRAADPQPGWSARVAAHGESARVRLSVRLIESLGSDVGALANWCLLDVQPEGDVDRWIEPFRTTGTIHLLSISGFHLTLVAGGCLLASRIATRGWRGSLFVALAAVLAYVAWVGAPPPAVRAAGMAIVLAAGPTSGRTQRSWNALGWAVAGVGVFEPAALFRPGFILSATAMMGVFLGGALGGRARARLLRRIPRLTPLGPILDLLTVSLGAFALTAAWSFLYFGELYPLGAFANLLVVPAMGVAFPAIVGAAAGVACGAGEGHPLVEVGVGAGMGILLLVRALSDPCASWALRGALDAAGAASLCAVIAASGWLLTRRRLRARGLLAGAALLVACAFARGDPGFPRSPSRQGEWSATFLDVGQGDAILIRLPGSVWLVDTGPPARGARALPGMLARRGVGHIDRVFLTHGDLDHWGGLPALLESTVRVDTLVLPYGVPMPDALRDALRRVRRTPTVVWASAGDSVTFGGGVRARFLHPAVTTRQPRDNDGSIVLTVEAAGGRKLLLCGDLELPGQTELLGRETSALRALVAQAGHHGSRTSSGAAWLERVGARLGIASLAAGNRFGFPHDDVVAAWRARSARLLRTDERGAITLSADARRWRVHTQRPRGPHAGGVL